MGRIPPRRELEERLERLRPHPHPDIALEQYTTPVAVASEMLFTAAYLHDDIADKLVADLGCGTGRLGIGALLLGAWRVVGIDIDPEAVKVAAENAVEAGVGDRCLWVVGDVSLLRGSFDTVVMNPPFGSRRRHADARFLSEALRLAGCVYSLHKSSTRPFVVDLIGRMGGVVTLLLEMELEIPWMFSFHEKRRRPVSVDLYRIVGQQRVYKKGGAKP